MVEHVKKWLDEVLYALTSGTFFGLGTLALVNEVLQTIAFIVSIVAGILAIRAHLIKRKVIQSESKESNGNGPTKGS